MRSISQRTAIIVAIVPRPRGAIAETGSRGIPSSGPSLNAGTNTMVVNSMAPIMKLKAAASAKFRSRNTLNRNSRNLDRRL